MSQRETEPPREESFRAVARLKFVQYNTTVEADKDRSVPNAATSPSDKDDLALEFFRHGDEVRGFQMIPKLMEICVQKIPWSCMCNGLQYLMMLTWRKVGVKWDVICKLA